MKQILYIKLTRQTDHKLTEIKRERFVDGFR